jgi:hypothetical protein
MTLYLYYTALNDRMTEEWWIREDLELRGHGLIEVQPPHLSGGTQENCKETSVRIASISAKIQTEHFRKSRVVLLDQPLLYNIIHAKKWLQ